MELKAISPPVSNFLEVKLDKNIIDFYGGLLVLQRLNKKVLSIIW